MAFDGLQQALLGWYEHSRRDLPWRRHAAGQEAAGLRPQPSYAVWVSEIMLQQTRVETVRDYYLRFLTRFSTVQALAAADLDDVLAVWAGLGYYARARHLHAAAKTIVGERGGQFPKTYQDWCRLPGVGPYTAAAVASIVDGEPHAVLDGNVLRVLSRLSAEEGDITRHAVRRRLQKLADRLLSHRHPGDHNQAMMELGATLCTPQAPHCLLCPVHEHCQAHRRGVQNVLPRRRDKHPVKTLRFFAAIVSRGDGAVLLSRRPANGLWGGLWEMPNCPAKGRRGQKMLGDYLQDQFHIQAQIGRCVGRLSHLLTHRHVRFMIYPAQVLTEGTVPDNGSAQTWCRPDDWSSMAISTATKKMLEKYAPD